MDDAEQADIVARVARAQAQVKGQVQQTQASRVTQTQVNPNNAPSGSLRQVGNVSTNAAAPIASSGTTGPAPIQTRVGSVIYYDVNTVMIDLYNQAVASGVPNVPRPPTEMRSFGDKASAQKIIDSYYAKIPVVYDVNDALKKAYDDAVAKGIPGVPQPNTFQSKFTDVTQAQKVIDTYAASIPPTYDVNTAIQSAYQEAVDKGIPLANLPKPSTTSTVYVDKAKADAYVKAYTDQIPPTYDVNSAIQDAYDQAVKLGIPTSALPKPTTTSTVYIDKAKADAFVKSYTDSIPPTYDVNSAVQQAYDQAVKLGIPASAMPKPSATSTVYIDKTKADAYIKSYTDKIPPTYDVNSAVQAVYDQAKASGIPVASLPSVPKTTTVFIDKSKADAYIKSYTDKLPATYDVNSAVQTVYNQAKAAGIPVASLPAVPKTTQVFVDKASADAYIKSYTDKIPSTYDPSVALQSVQTQAKVAGITNIPALPTIGVYTSQAAAQKVVDDYVAKVNASAPVSKVASTPVASAPTASAPTASAPTVTTYDASSALQSIQTQAKAAGITNIPALPTAGGYTTQAAAQKVVDDYAAKINANATQQTLAATQASTKTVQPTSAPAYDITKDPNALNQYKMTQAEWSQYQTAVAGIPMADRPGPMMWMYDNHNPKVPDMPFNNQYVYVGGSFVPDSYQTQSLKDQMALNASKVYNVDPQKTGGYQFAQALNDDNSSKYLKAVQSNPSLTEFQWRQQNAGKDNGGAPIDLAAIPGNWATPAVIGNSFSTSNASIGTIKVISAGVDITSKSTPQSPVANVAPVASSAKIDTSGANVKVITTSGVDVTSQRTPQTIVSTQKATSSNISASAVKIDTSGAGVKVITTGGVDVTSQRTPQSPVTTQKPVVTNVSATMVSTPKIIPATALSSSTPSSNAVAFTAGNSPLAQYNRAVQAQATKTGMDTVINASGALSAVAKPAVVATSASLTKQATPASNLFTLNPSNSLLSPIVNTGVQNLVAQLTPKPAAQVTQVAPVTKAPVVSQNTGWSSVLGGASDLVTKGENFLGSAVSVGQKAYADVSKVVSDNVNAFTSNFDSTVNKNNNGIDNGIVSTVNSYLGNAGKSLDNYVSSVMSPSVSKQSAVSDLPTTSASSNDDKYNALLNGIKSIGTIATDAATFAVNAINPSNYSSAQAQSDAKANQLIATLNDWNKTYVDPKSSDYNSEKMSYGLDMANQIKSISGDNVNVMVNALDTNTRDAALNQSNTNINKLLGMLNSTTPGEFNTTKQAEQVDLATFLDSKLGTNTSSVLTSAQNDAKKNAGSLLATVNKDYASGTSSAGFGSGLTLDNIMGLGNKLYSEGSAFVSDPSKYISDKEKAAEDYIGGVENRIGEETTGLKADIDKELAHISDRINPSVKVSAGAKGSTASVVSTGSSNKLSTSDLVSKPVSSNVISASSASHAGQTMLPDGTWKDNSGATVNHTGQTLLKNGTWLDDWQNIGASSDGIQSQVTSTKINVSSADVKAAAKNINNVFILNSDGTASIKAGVTPTSADVIALDNAQYTLKDNAVKNPNVLSTVAFGSSKVTGTWNPKTGMITSPVDRENVVTTQTQAKANSEQYAKDVKAVQTIGANGEIIDAVQRVGSAGVGDNNVKVINPLFATTVAKNQFLADSKAEYNILNDSNKKSVKDLVKTASKDTSAQQSLVKMSKLDDNVKMDMSGVSLVSQNSGDIIKSSAQRAELAGKAKLTVTSNMTEEEKASVDKYNAAIDNARADEQARASSVANKYVLSNKYSNIDHPVLSASIIPTQFDGLKGLLVSAGTPIANELAREAENTYGFFKDAATGLGAGYDYIKGTSIGGNAINTISDAVNEEVSEVGIVANKGVDLLGVAGQYQVDHSIEGSDAKRIGTAWVNYAKGDSNARIKGAEDVVAGYGGMVLDGLGALDSDVSGITSILPSSSAIANWQPVKDASDIGNAIGANVSKGSEANKNVVDFTKSAGGTLLGIVGGGYDFFREHPITTGAMVGATIIGGEVMGAGFEGAQVVGRGVLGGGGDLIDAAVNASFKNRGSLAKIADLIGERSGERTVRGISGIASGTLKLGAKAVDPVADTYFKEQIVDSALHSTDGTDNATDAGAQFGKWSYGTAAGLLGFKRGSEAMKKFSERGELPLLGKSEVPWLDMSKVEPHLSREDVLGFGDGKIVENGEGVGTYIPGKIIENTVRMSNGETAKIEFGEVTNTKKLITIDEDGNPSRTVEVPTQRKAKINGEETTIDVSVKDINGRIVEIARVPMSERYKTPTIAGNIVDATKGIKVVTDVATDIAVRKTPALIDNVVNKYTSLVDSLVSNSPSLTNSIATGGPSVLTTKVKTGASAKPAKPAVSAKPAEPSISVKLSDNGVITPTGIGVAAQPSVSGTVSRLSNMLSSVKKDFAVTKESADISHIVGSGGQSSSATDRYGERWKIGDKTVLSKMYGGKYQLGSPSAPEYLFKDAPRRDGTARDRQLKAQTEDQRESMVATLKANTSPADVQYFESLQNLVDKSLATPNIVPLPTDFELTASAVPETIRGMDARSDTLEAIRTVIHKGTDIQISGSSATYNQIGEYMGRSVHDVELYVDNPSLEGADLTGANVESVKAAAAIVKEMRAKGYTENEVRQGVDENGNLTAKVDYYGGQKGWDHAVELFDHNLANQAKEDVGLGRKGTAGVMIGDILALSQADQLGRKADASSVLTNKEIGPRFAPNIKHAADSIDMGTERVVRGKVDAEADLVDLVNASYAKFHDNPTYTADPKGGNIYEEKLGKNPNFKFVLEHQRAPTEAEIANRAPDGSMIADPKIPDGKRRPLPSTRVPTSRGQNVSAKASLSELRGLSTTTSPEFSFGVADANNISGKIAKFGKTAAKYENDWTVLTPVSDTITKARMLTGGIRGQALETFPALGHDHVTMLNRRNVTEAIISGQRVNLSRATGGGTEVGSILSNKGDPYIRSIIRDADGNIISNPGDKKTFDKQTHLNLIAEIKQDGNPNHLVIDESPDPVYFKEAGGADAYGKGQVVPGMFFSVSMPGEKTNPHSGIFSRNGPNANPNPMGLGKRLVQKGLTGVANVAEEHSLLGNLTEHLNSSDIITNANVGSSNLAERVVNLNGKQMPIVISDVATTKDVNYGKEITIDTRKEIITDKDGSQHVALIGEIGNKDVILQIDGKDTGNKINVGGKNVSLTLGDKISSRTEANYGTNYGKDIIIETHKATLDGKTYKGTVKKASIGGDVIDVDVRTETRNDKKYEIATVNGKDVIVKIDGKLTGDKVTINGKEVTLTLGDKVVTTADKLVKKVIPGMDKVAKITRMRAMLGGEPIEVTSHNQNFGDKRVEITTINGAKRKEVPKAEQMINSLVSKSGSMIAKAGDVKNPGTYYKGGEVLVLEDVSGLTGLTPEKQNEIMRDFTSGNSGKITQKNLNLMVDSGLEQVRTTGEPVAILTPKTARGWTHQENEVFLLTPDNITEITAMRKAGKTLSNIDIKKISLGSMKKPSILSPLSSKLENAKWNTSLGVDEYGVYNKSLQKYEENVTVRPKIAQLLTKKQSMQPGAYEAGEHGMGHIIGVKGELKARGDVLEKTHPEIMKNITQEYRDLMAEFHDMDKIGSKDNSGVNHGIVIARAIKAGRTGDPRVDNLPAKERAQLARDLAYHEKQQPWSSGDLPAALKTSLIYRTSDAAKLFSNSDRGDLKRLGIETNENKIFGIGYWKDVRSDIRDIPSRTAKGVDTLVNQNTARVGRAVNTTIRGINAMIGDETASIGVKPRQNPNPKGVNAEDSVTAVLTGGRNNLDSLMSSETDNSSLIGRANNDRVTPVEATKPSIISAGNSDTATRNMLGTSGDSSNISTVHNDMPISTGRSPAIKNESDGSMVKPRGSVDMKASRETKKPVSGMDDFYNAITSGKKSNAPVVNMKDSNVSGVDKTNIEDKKTDMYDSIVGEKKEIVENKPKYDITKEKSTIEEEFILKKDDYKDITKEKNDDYYKGMLGTKKSGYSDTISTKKTDYSATSKPSVYDFLNGSKSGKPIESKSGKMPIESKSGKEIVESKSGKEIIESKSGKEIIESKSGKEGSIEKYGIEAYSKNYDNKYDNKYGNSYDSKYGNSYGNSYDSKYGNSYGMSNYNVPSGYKSPSGSYTSDYVSKNVPYAGNYGNGSYPSTSDYKPTPAPYNGGYNYKNGKPTIEKPRPEKKIKMPSDHKNIKRELQVDADKLISKTKVQTFAEMIGGAATPTTSAPTTSAFAKSSKQDKSVIKTPVATFGDMAGTKMGKTPKITGAPIDTIQTPTSLTQAIGQFASTPKSLPNQTKQLPKAATRMLPKATAKKPSKQVPKSTPNHMSRADIQTLAPAIQSKVVAYEKTKKQMKQATQQKASQSTGMFESMLGSTIKTMTQPPARLTPQAKSMKQQAKPTILQQGRSQQPSQAKPQGFAGALFGVTQNNGNKPVNKENNSTNKNGKSSGMLNGLV